jgi:hypothetical protein
VSSISMLYCACFGRCNCQQHQSECRLLHECMFLGGFVSGGCGVLAEVANSPGDTNNLCAAVAFTRIKSPAPSSAGLPLAHDLPSVLTHVTHLSKLPGACRCKTLWISNNNNDAAICYCLRVRHNTAQNTFLLVCCRAACAPGLTRRVW